MYLYIDAQLQGVTAHELGFTLTWCENARILPRSVARRRGRSENG